MFVLAIALSVLVGIALGLLGGGGSILMVPILRYTLGLEAHRAIALSLLVVGTTSLAALIPYARRGSVRWRTGVIFGLSGMTGAYLAGRMAKFVPPGILLVAFGAMMLVTAAAMLRSRRAARSATAEGSELPVLKVLAEGLVVGAVTGLVGAGGGFLVVPALVLLGGLPMDIAVATSLLVIAMKSFAGFVGFLGHTPIDWSLALAVSAAAILGSAAGIGLSGRVHPRALQRGFGWFVLAMAFFMLAQELPLLLNGAPNLPLSLLASAVGTGAIAILRALVRRGPQRSEAPVPQAPRRPWLARHV